MLQKAELREFNKALGSKHYDRLPIIFNALGDPTRCKIARLLIRKKRLRLTVNEIAEILKISQSSASQHIKILEITGIVNKTREGKKRLTEVNTRDPIVKALSKAIL